MNPSREHSGKVRKKIVCQEVMTEKKARREKNIPAAKGDKKCVLLHPKKNKGK